MTVPTPPSSPETEWREILTLVGKVLAVILAGLAVLWLIGWVLRLASALLLGIASLVVAVLSFLVPVAIIAAAVYFGVRALRPADAMASRGQGRPAADPLATEGSDKLEDVPLRVPDHQA